MDQGSRIWWSSQLGYWWIGMVYNNKGLGGPVASGRIGRYFYFVGDGGASNPYHHPKIDWTGWLRLNSDMPYQATLIEMGGQNDYQAVPLLLLQLVQCQGPQLLQVLLALWHKMLPMFIFVMLQIPGPELTELQVGNKWQI
jgi:hypothetical protein